MNSISSVHNELIKNISALKTASGRREAQQFIAEGERICTTFIKAGWQPVHLLAIEKQYDLAHNLAPQKTILVTDAIMKKISCATTPSGLLAVFAIPFQQPPQQLSSGGIVLANITDPGNIGTLIRSAAAFGAQTVVCVQGCDPYSPKVVQAAAGAHTQVQLFEWSWQELLEYTKQLSLVALVPYGGAHPRQFLKSPFLFVVGNEAHGIAPEWLAGCQAQVTLPMAAGVESLNAAVAGSIILALRIL